MLENFSMPEIISSDRIKLVSRNSHIYDENCWLEVDNNRLFLRRYLPWVDNTNSLQDVIDTTKMFIDWWNKGENFAYFIILNETEKVIGSIDIHSIDYNNYSTEIGYWLSEAYNGKGYMSEAVKLIEDENEDVNIIVGERLISFNVNGYDFISRLLEGDFVNYKKTLPREYKQKVTVNTRDLINTIERVSLLISESFTTPVRCYFNELNVVFTCATSQGRATETFNTKLEGENFEIGLNNHYLLDALKAIEDENINILFNGSNAGVLITPIDNDNFKYMIMPMRLK